MVLGVMVVEPKVFGPVYLHAPHNEEDLLFAARRNDPGDGADQTSTSWSSTRARPETLIPGNCYFSVGYYNNDLL